MTIEAAIMLLIWAAVIVGVAYVAVYLAGRAGAPAPVSTIIWIVALLLVLLLLLRFVGVLHAAERLLLA